MKSNTAFYGMPTMKSLYGGSERLPALLGWTLGHYGQVFAVQGDATSRGSSLLCIRSLITTSVLPN